MVLGTLALLQMLSSLFVERYRILDRFPGQFHPEPEDDVFSGRLC